MKAQIQHYSVPQDQPINSCHWYRREETVGRTEACIFAAHFKRLLEQRFGNVKALITAYKYLFEFAQGIPHLTFEQVFDLAAKTDGCWAYRNPLAMSVCDRCECQYICCLEDKHVECPFCDVLHEEHQAELTTTSGLCGVQHEQN